MFLKLSEGYRVVSNNGRGPLSLDTIQLDGPIFPLCGTKFSGREPRVVICGDTLRFLTFGWVTVPLAGQPHGTRVRGEMRRATLYARRGMYYYDGVFYRTMAMETLWSQRDSHTFDQALAEPPAIPKRPRRPMLDSEPPEPVPRRFNVVKR